MAFNFLTGAVDQIGGAISKGADSLGNLFNDATEAGSDAIDSFSDGVDWEDFDMENPDGVHVNLRKNNLNRIQSDAILNDNLDIGARPGTRITNTNVTNQRQNIFYTEEIPATEYETEDGTSIKVSPRPFSLFNNFSLVDFRGEPLNEVGGQGSKSEHYNKIDQKTLQNPTASRIIELTNTGTTVGYSYDYKDFALSKYFGKIPNNMMITLRRFAFPTPDDIVSPQAVDKNNQKIEITQPPIAKAITYLGETPGNTLADILKFSHGFNWKEAEAQVQELQSQRGARSGAVGEFINNSSLLSAAANAAAGRDAYDSAVNRANAGFDAFSNTYPNHVFGPLNVIKQVMVREQGLTFEQEFTLKFEFELRELGGANPKILMLDQLANLMALTYNNAPFWGGDVRYIGDGSVTSPLGDLKHLKSGNYGSFFGSVVEDLKGMGAAIFDDVSNSENIFKGIGNSKFLNNILGGGLQKLLNSPQGGQAAASLLTGDPTGQWHLTLGNPLNPIMVLGNLICTNTEINFEGAMGVQDFPEKLVMTVSLKPGRPRDKAEIESMFNAGRGRFYVQPKDGIDINDDVNISAYGNKDRVNHVNKFSNYKKIGLG